MRNILLLGMVLLVFISGCTSQGIVINNISTDKSVYHSAEVMNLTARIYSEAELENVTVAVYGIDGRFNTEKNLDLEKGVNELSFTYTLPRCNVCGGIRAGDYNLSFSVRYKNITTVDSTIINIQQ
jgi:hypothetical protein